MCVRWSAGGTECRARARTIWELFEISISFPLGARKRPLQENAHSKRSHVNGYHLTTGESAGHPPAYSVLIGFAKTSAPDMMLIDTRYRVDVALRMGTMDGQQYIARTSRARRRPQYTSSFGYNIISCIADGRCTVPSTNERRARDGTNTTQRNATPHRAA